MTAARQRLGRCRASLLRWAHRRRAGGETGRAIVEFIFLGVVLLVPLAYLVGTLAATQAATFAVTTAAREAGRAYATADTEAAGLARARAAAAVSFEDYGHLAGEAGSDLTIVCDGAPCLRPEGRVTVTATLTVRLPMVPDFLAGAVPTIMPVSATHVATVDRFGGR